MVKRTFPKASRKILLRLKQTEALKEYQGIFSPDEYPEFKDRDSIEAWVRSLRREADERLARVFSKSRIEKPPT